MENLTLYQTNSELFSDNYPYGFRLKTRKTDYLEFKPGKGFRHCSYTINPKTGRANAIKKGVYYDLLVLTRNKTNDHVRSIALDFNGDKNINNTSKFIYENFKLFSKENIEFFAMQILLYTKVSIQAQITYCGSKFEDLKPLFEPVIKTAVKIAKTYENLFNEINLDLEKIESFKVPNFQPFKITEYQIIG